MCRQYRRKQSMALPAFAAMLAVTGTAMAGVIWDRASVTPAGEPTWMTSGLIDTHTGYANGSFADFYVESEVYSLANDPNDLGEGLGFVYQFFAPAGYTGDYLDSARFIDDDWAGWTIENAGANQTGQSTDVGTGGWDTGEPSYIMITSDAPKVFFTDKAVGTHIGGGDYTPGQAESSGLIWWEVPNVRDYKLGRVTLQDGSGTSEAQVLVAPAPSAVVLGCVGFGCAAFAVWRQRRGRPLADTGF